MNRYGDVLAFRRCCPTGRSRHRNALIETTTTTIARHAAAPPFFLGAAGEARRKIALRRLNMSFHRGVAPSLGSARRSDHRRWSTPLPAADPRRPRPAAEPTAPDGGVPGRPAAPARMRPRSFLDKVTAGDQRFPAPSRWPSWRSLWTSESVGLGLPRLLRLPSGKDRGAAPCDHLMGQKSGRRRGGRPRSCPGRVSSPVALSHRPLVHATVQVRGRFRRWLITCATLTI